MWIKISIISLVSSQVWDWDYRGSLGLYGAYTAASELLTFLHIEISVYETLISGSPTDEIHTSTRLSHQWYNLLHATRSLHLFSSPITLHRKIEAFSWCSYRLLSISHNHIRYPIIHTMSASSNPVTQSVIRYKSRCSSKYSISCTCISLIWYWERERRERSCAAGYPSY